MAFTDNCDLYGAVHEDGVNRVIEHVMRQRPSLFNYATADVAEPENRELWCQPVDATGDIFKYKNPLFTIVNPVPVLGADSPPVGLGFCAQISKAQIDFHPGKNIALPAELNPPLKEQHFALQFRVCGAVACPNPKASVSRRIEAVRPVPVPEVCGRVVRDDDAGLEASELSRPARERDDSVGRCHGQIEKDMAECSVIARARRIQVQITVQPSIRKCSRVDDPRAGRHLLEV